MQLKFLLAIFLICPKQNHALTPINLLAYTIVNPAINNFLNAASNKTECTEDLKLLAKSTFNLDFWALKMVDANNKFLNPGMLEGNVRFLGSFDECMTVKKKLSHDKTVTGQYCTANVVFKENDSNFFYKLANSLIRGQNFKKPANLQSAKISFDFCVPNSCSAEELNQLYSNVAKMLNFPIKILFSENTCFYEGKEVESNWVDVYVFWFFGLVFAVLLASTIYDIYLKIFGKNENILISGSMYTNMKKLLSTHCENNSLTCMYGIRVISMMWIVFGHVTLFKNVTYDTHLLETVKLINRPESVIFLAAPYAVETFFSIGGILSIYVYFVYNNEMKNNIFLFYLHRLIRLVPTLVAAILFNLSLVKYMINGPLAPSILQMTSNSCKQSWWYSLFFISNFNDASKQCVDQDWYLSIDTQLYLLYPFIIYAIKKNPKLTLQGLCTICLLSIIYTFYKVLKNNLGFIMVMEVPGSDMHFVYYSTISRMAPVLIGLCFGYLIYRNSLEKIQISNMLNICLWITSLSVMLVLVLYHNILMREEFDVWRSAFFNSVSRALWSLAVCFIIFSCSTGHGGFVNTFLSHPVFIVLGKLTYSLYIVHMTIIHIVVGNMKQLNHFTYFQCFSDFCGIYVCSVIVSIIVWLMFEAPIFSFLKHLEKVTSKDKTT